MVVAFISRRFFAVLDRFLRTPLDTGQALLAVVPPNRLAGFQGRRNLAQFVAGGKGLLDSAVTTARRPLFPQVGTTGDYVNGSLVSECDDLISPCFAHSASLTGASAESKALTPPISALRGG